MSIKDIPNFFGILNCYLFPSRIDIEFTVFIFKKIVLMDIIICTSIINLTF